MEIVRARRWTDGRGDIRYYITARDERGQEREFTRFVTGNRWHPAKTWGDEGEPDAATLAEYRRLTDGGRKSYELQEHFSGSYNHPDNEDVPGARVVENEYVAPAIIEDHPYED